MKMKKIRGYIVSFILPIVLLLIVFAFLGIYPFGSKDLLWFDTQAQYIDFLSYWQDVIKGKASVLYSFSKSLGGNMYGLVTYYLMSPINLIVIFFTKINLPLAFMIIILLKIGLCGVGFNYYLSNSKFVESSSKCLEIKKIIFSLMYAMLSYNIAYSMSHMWLDCVALLPIIFLGLEKIIYDKKWELYLLSFTLSIIVNYYISFMIAFFTIPYFCYVLLCNNKNKKISVVIKENKKSIWQYIKISLISVLISGVIIVPTLCTLISSKWQGISSDFLMGNTSFDFLTLFAKNILGAFSMNELSIGAPNIYCGLMSLLLVLMYFLNKDIDRKEKKYTGIFILLFFVCFFFNPVNLFLHMLHSPLCFPFRYSFIFSFVMLILAYKCINNMNDFSLKKVIIICGVLISALIFVYCKKYEFLTNTKIFITFIFIILYSVILFKISKFGILGHMIAMLLVCIELVVNGYFVMNWMPYGDRNVYINQLNRYTDIYDYIADADNGLYRISSSGRKSLNDALMYNFAGIEHNSSLEEKTIKNFLSSLGYYGFSFIEYDRGTILDNSLLGVKYLLSARNVDFYKVKNTINGVSIYENPYALSLGYVSSHKILDFDSEYEFDNPFEYQNYIFGLITGNETEYFSPAKYEITEYNNLDIQESDDSYSIKIVNQDNFGYLNITIENLNKPIYSYLLPGVRNGMVSFMVNDEQIQTMNSNISYIGCSDEKINLKIMVYGNIELSKNFLNYLDDEIVIEELLNLKEKALEIIDYDDNYIKGTITLEQAETLFTTIPYEKGWTVVVNGEEVEAEKALDTFILLKLSGGKNIIEFKYKSPGLSVGLLTSSVGIILLCFELFFDKKYLFTRAIRKIKK